jgi:hypothetical protein
MSPFLTKISQKHQGGGRQNYRELPVHFLFLYLLYLLYLLNLLIPPPYSARNSLLLISLRTLSVTTGWVSVTPLPITSHSPCPPLLL